MLNAKKRKNMVHGFGINASQLQSRLVFAGSVRSGLLTFRDMDRDLDRSTVTIKGKKTGLNRPRPQFSVHGPVLTSPGLNWFKTGLDRFFC